MEELHVFGARPAYEILALIGAVSMCDMFRARDAKLKRGVAIKVLLEAYASDPVGIAHFQRDARAIALAESSTSLASVHSARTT